MNIVSIIFRKEDVMKWVEMKSLPSTDLNYITHYLLCFIFGDNRIKTFLIDSNSEKYFSVLGYSELTGEELKASIPLSCSPYVLSCIDVIKSKKMPLSEIEGKTLSFEIKYVPVSLVEGKEKDVFKIPSVKRENKEETYIGFLSEKLKEVGFIENAFVKSFRYEEMIRKCNKNFIVIKKPVVIIRGSIMIQSSDALKKIMLSGVGRHSTFGYGTLFLVA